MWIDACNASVKGVCEERIMSQISMDEVLNVPPAPDPPQTSEERAVNGFISRLSKVPAMPPSVARSETTSEHGYKRESVIDPYGPLFEHAETEMSANTMSPASKRRGGYGGHSSHAMMYLLGGCVLSTLFCVIAFIPLCGWKVENGQQRQSRLFYCVGVVLGLLVFVAIASVVVILILGVYGEDFDA